MIRYGMSLHIMGKVFHYPASQQSSFNSGDDFARFLDNAIKSGMSQAELKAEINKYQQMHSEPETPPMNIDIPCKKWPHMDNAVWDELLDRYDIDNLDYQEKRELADDFMEKGVISQIDRDRFVAMLNRKEEQALNPQQSSKPNYDKVLPTLSDRLEVTFENVTFGSELSEAAKDEIFAHLELEHLINHLKAYAKNKEYILTNG